jgi:hypothetical protein
MSNNGWIDWLGGECPVADHAPVTVRFRNGKTCDTEMPAKAWAWFHDGDGFDIVAYRLHQAATNFCMATGSPEFLTEANDNRRFAVMDFTQGGPDFTEELPHPKAPTIPLADLNRRVEVETVLLSVFAGKRGPLTKEECRNLAFKLGVPDKHSKKEWLVSADAQNEPINGA